MRKILTVFTIFCLAQASVWAGEISCSSEMKCTDPNPHSNVITTDMPKCTGHYGGFPGLGEEAQHLISQHVEASMKFLLLSNRFDYWKTQRKGLYNLLIKLSDDAFEDAITIMEHSAKRGGKLFNFNVTMPTDVKYELTEIEALSKALDYTKDIAIKTSQLIHLAYHGNKNDDREPDGEFAHFLAEEIGEKHSQRVHTLASHVRNLGQAISSAVDSPKDLALVLYLYDTQFLS